MKPLLPPLVAAAILTGCQTMGEVPASVVGKATLKLASGAHAGTARLLQSGTEATLSITLIGLPEGRYQVNLGPAGSCGSTDFDPAGQPPNGATREHSVEKPQKARFVKLPDAMVGSAGTGTVSAHLRGTAQDVTSQIWDADGAAIIIQADADAPQTTLTGRSDDLMACGALMPS